MPRVPRNPLLSVWLSAANRVANAGRGVVMAASRRQQAAATAAATKEVTSFWTRALRGAAKPGSRKGK